VRTISPVPQSTPRHAAGAATRALLVLFCAATLGACGKQDPVVPVAGGDVEVGKRLVEQYQCGSCHAIPGVAAARGTAGPPLQGFGRRSYIAGRIPNVPEQLSQWLQDPPAMKPGTLMPDLGISPADARHMSAWLYTLR
jgi:cytochrome c